MTTSIPAGLCQCGCGAFTRISTVNNKAKGWVKDKPVAYLKGHHLRGDKAGPKSPRWKGGRQLSSHGYVVLWTPDGRQYEHILQAEQVLGRKLRQISPGHPDNEVVHHIDGDKQNNSPANLLICTHSYHVELHHRLEGHPDWPQFKKVERFTKEKARVRHDRPSQ